MKSDKTLPSSTPNVASKRPFSNRPPLPSAKSQRPLPKKNQLSSKPLGFKETKKKNDGSRKSLIEDKTSTSESITTAHGAAPPPPIEIAPAPEPAPSAPTPRKRIPKAAPSNEIEPALAPAPTLAPAPRRHEKKVATTKQAPPPSSTSSTSTAPTPSNTSPIIDSLAPTPTPIPAAPASKNPKYRTPMTFFNDSILSPTLIEQQHGNHQKQQQPIQTSQEEFLKKIKHNISEIQEIQAKQFSWIRKLSNQKWFIFLDTVLAGFTLLFFSTAFYLIFHVNPTLQLKLTPEFHHKIFSNFNKFDHCNHTSWRRTNDSLAPIIDYRNCFNKFENGRSFYEIYKSSTPNSSDICNMDRIEAHDCYIEKNENDMKKIFWGVNDTEFNYTCNASDFRNINSQSIFSFNPPVRKYAMMNNYTFPYFINRTLSSMAFFFQCPKCNLINQIHPPKNILSKMNVSSSNRYWYKFAEISSSIPSGSRICIPWMKTAEKCNLIKSKFIHDSQKSFSRIVLPFEIIDDRKC